MTFATPTGMSRRHFMAHMAGSAAAASAAMSFTHSLRAQSAALKKNHLPIGARDRNVVGWDFTGTGDWRGLAHVQRDPHPSQRIVVNLAHPRYPQVYVVSSARP